MRSNERPPDEPTVEQAEAWREYLEEIEQLSVHRYEEVEPWAWRRLQRRLKDAAA